MYARHFFHLKRIQLRHTLLVDPVFIGAAIIALFLFLLNLPQPASEEQLKSAFLLVQIGSLFLLIWCQILDLFVFWDAGAREITKCFQLRIFLWDIASFALFFVVLLPVLVQFCKIDVRLSNGWRILFLQLLWMRIVFFSCSSTKVSIAGAAAICLIVMAISWYQGTIFGADIGLLVCRMLPDDVPQSWYQWQVASGFAIVAMLNILLTDRNGLFIIKLKKS